MTAAYRLAQATPVAAELLRRLKADLGDDETLLHDTVEGQTNLLEFIEKAMRQVSQDEGMIDGIDVEIARLEARKKRYRQRIDKTEAVVLHALEETGMRSIELPTCTLSVRVGKPSVQIYDEEALPQGFWRWKKEPNKQFIKETIQSGEQVPGASLSNTPPFLMIRWS